MVIFMPTVLFLTNVMRRYTGAEMVILELAEALRDFGCDLSLAANRIDDPVLYHLNIAGVSCVPYENVFDFDFDLVFSLHHILAQTNLESLLHTSRPFPAFVFAHLSPFAPLEMPGPILEKALAEVVFANSDETRKKVLDLGFSPDSIVVTHNAAPTSFRVDQRAYSSNLSKLLIVTNHLQPEVQTAVEILGNQGVSIRFLGFEGESRRISRGDVLWADAVMTIGKTVQYCLLSRTPTFIYDVFGGPGWLDETNFEQTSFYNFSGRPAQMKLDPEGIVHSLLSHYEKAVCFCKNMKEVDLERYKLEPYAQSILDLSKDLSLRARQKESLKQLFADEKQHYLFECERAMALSIKEAMDGAW